jgi:two-component system chemotaxis response regulator CheB
VRVLVADDAILFRRLLRDVLASLPGVEVVGTATNGRIAVEKARELKPDLLTLDIEMPEMDGLAVLDELLRKGQPQVEIIVVSALSRRGGDLTMRALEKGAFDFITKPEAATPEKGREALLRELAPRVRAAAHRVEVRTILRGDSRPLRPDLAAPAPVSQRAQADRGFHDISSRMRRLSLPQRPEMVLIGVSTGGPAALAQLLPAIPRDIGVPILIVQHMPPIFTKSLADSLAARCAVEVREAAHGELPQPNTAYIAPGGRQMRLVRGTENRAVLELTDDPPENNCRPAVDYLFRSAANHFPGSSMAVILAGMGSDGTIGLRLLKRHGCFVIAQDEASSVVYGMPKAAVDAGVADVILPLSSIAGRIGAVVKGGLL